MKRNLIRLSLARPNKLIYKDCSCIVHLKEHYQISGFSSVWRMMGEKVAHVKARCNCRPYRLDVLPPTSALLYSPSFLNSSFVLSHFFLRLFLVVVVGIFYLKISRKTESRHYSGGDCRCFLLGSFFFFLSSS